MEANRDVNQFDENAGIESRSQLQAESCRQCDGPGADGIRPNMGSNMRPGNGRPAGMRPNMRPGDNRPCNNRPCGMRPNMRPGNGRPNMRPGDSRPCNNRPCGMRPNMRPNNGLPDGWRPSDGMRSNSVMDDGDLHSEWNCGNRTIRDSAGRSMVVGCEGQTMSGCHMNDPMERLGDAFPPVMAFVPWQQWGDLYDPECGLSEGTIFKDLNYIFCGTRC